MKTWSNAIKGRSIAINTIVKGVTVIHLQSETYHMCGQAGLLLICERVVLHWRLSDLIICVGDL